MKQYSFKTGCESAVPVFKRKTVANLNKARSALLRGMYAVDEAIAAFDECGDQVASVKGRQIVEHIGALREWIDDRGTKDSV